MAVHIFGIRHHGPGCARGLRTALEQLAPDIVLVEGPPDAELALPLLAREELKPPVALLIYAPDSPHRAAYYPFTYFSPEWQALHHALRHGIPARFMDLPQAIALAREPKLPAEAAPSDVPGAPDLPAAADGRAPHPAQGTADDAISPGAVATVAPPEVVTPAPLEDPLAMLAEAAGYSDHELWWEQQIEQRRDADGLFEGILEAMTALRDGTSPRDEEEAQREAHMRRTIRAAEKEGFQRIAVVCGAWHAPALTAPGAAKDDAALLAGLKRIKVEATWIPWTNSRLSYRSGYGAGVTSPGWYAHLWNDDERGAIRWVTHAAHLLRAEGLDVSSASVIEAVRLGETLAALRELPMAGMAELHEAIQTVLCHGEAAPMQLIRDKLEIGEQLGEVPADTPAVPLQRDLEARQRRLRLRPATDVQTLDLDLRNDTDRARSQLLHQLKLLGIPWGTLRREHGKAGSFHEYWQLQWQVEFPVALIEANIWGNTVETAATAFARHSAEEASDLPQLTELLDRVILAELPAAVDCVLERVQAQAAVSAEVRHLMDALPPLARVARYGDVRQTKAERVLPVIAALFERAVVGLPGACASLDDDAAASMVESIDRAQESVSLLDREDMRGDWQTVLRRLIDNDGVHGLVGGRCCRLLLEQRVLDEAELRRLAGLTLAPVVPAAQAAAWVEGVLRGSGLLLLHQDGLWSALDAWLADLPTDLFVALLPMLRRAFSGFQPPEHQAMGEKVKHLRADARAGIATTAGDAGATPLDTERANAVLPVLAHLLGVTYDGD
jgi:Family of unknown function (DUF5682)